MKPMQRLFSYSVFTTSTPYSAIISSSIHHHYYRHESSNGNGNEPCLYTFKAPTRTTLSLFLLLRFATLVYSPTETLLKNGAFPPSNSCENNSLRRLILELFYVNNVLTAHLIASQLHLLNEQFHILSYHYYTWLAVNNISQA